MMREKQRADISGRCGGVVLVSLVSARSAPYKELGFAP